jgi:hypothetical protein
MFDVCCPSLESQKILKKQSSDENETTAWRKQLYKWWLRVEQFDSGIKHYRRQADT